MKHLKDFNRHVHCDEPGGAGYTLCGEATEGVNGDEPMQETAEGIDCDRCIALIEFCWKIRRGEIKPRFQRRRVG